MKKNYRKVKIRVPLQKCAKRSFQPLKNTFYENCYFAVFAEVFQSKQQKRLLLSNYKKVKITVLFLNCAKRSFQALKNTGTFYENCYFAMFAAGLQ